MSEYIKKLRSKIGTEKILIPTAGCIIVNNTNEVLMQKRTDQKNWGCPGGMVEPNETVLEALHREVYEETHLEIHNPILFGIYSGPKFERIYPHGDITQSVISVFVVSKFSGHLKSNGESTELKFFSVNNFPSPLNNHSLEYLQHYREYIQGERKIPIIL